MIGLRVQFLWYHCCLTGNLSLLLYFLRPELSKGGLRNTVYLLPFPADVLDLLVGLLDDEDVGDLPAGAALGGHDRHRLVLVAAGVEHHAVRVGGVGRGLVGWEGTVVLE